MRLRRFYKLVMLAFAGGLVFQATASCSTDMMNAISDSLGATFDAQIAGFITESLASCTSAS